MLKRFLSLAVALLIFGGALANTNAQESADLAIIITDATGTEVEIRSLDRIISASGDVTEIIYALGFYPQMVAVDRTSTYPPNVLLDLPDIGFARALSAEPIAALDPTLVFCTQICAPSAVFEQLRGLGIAVVIVPDSEGGGLEMPFLKIEMVAAALGVPERGAALAETLRQELDWVVTALANTSTNPSVFHLYSRGRGLQLAVGADTPIDAMIRAAGGYNAALDAEISGYLPLSPEIILSAFPEFLLLTEGNIEASGGLDAMLDLPGLRATPAAQNGNIIVLDTQLLLGMSLRTGEALMQIAQALHPDMTWEAEVTYPYTYTDYLGNETTVTEARPIVIGYYGLAEIVRALGFATIGMDEMQPGDIVLLKLPELEAGYDAVYTVLGLSQTPTIAEIAAALNVPGRGEALSIRWGID